MNPNPDPINTSPMPEELILLSDMSEALERIASKPEPKAPVVNVAAPNVSLAARAAWCGTIEIERDAEGRPWRLHCTPQASKHP